MCKSLVSVNTFSSTVPFNQVSVTMMKSVFSSLLVSTICCLLFIDPILIVAIFILFELFFLVILICIKLFEFAFFGLS